MQKLLYTIFVLAIFCTLCAFADASEMPQSQKNLVSEVGEGYIVTVVGDTSHIQSDAMLFGESLVPCDISGVQVVEFISENVDNTRPLISEMSLIKVEDKQTLDELVSLGLVESYEPNDLLYLTGYDYSGNARYDSQWGHKAIKSEYAWKAGVFGTDVRIAVIDSGVYLHKDLLHCIEEGYNYLNNTKDVTDKTGHGTFVAGIIAAQCNDIATVGLAHRAKIVPLKVTNTGTIEFDDAILAIRDAVDVFDCDILNLSFATGVDSSGLKSAVEYASSKGAIIVASSGNGIKFMDWDENGKVFYFYDYEIYAYPAAYENVISVANIEKGAIGEYVIRNTSTHNDMVDIAAPGTDVCSLNMTQTGFDVKSGTSYSAPYVTASAALARSVLPDITQRQFEDILKKTANPAYMTSEQGSDYWGSGMLDVEKMMKYLLKENFGDFYLSPPDKQIFGNNTSVYITNLKDTEKNFGSLIIYNHAPNEKGFSVLNKVKIVPIKLGGGESMEISFTELGMFGEISYTLLSDKMKPLVNPLRKVRVDK